MSTQTTGSEHPEPGTARPEGALRALRVLALAAVGGGLAALAAGTFVLSYSGIHVLALQAGITPRLARGYPLLIDAMLVIVLAAILGLRGAGVPSKLFAWVTLLAVLAAAASADALHAAGRKLPGHLAAVTAAVLPWVLVFLAFALLLTMLRHARVRRLSAARGRETSQRDALTWRQPGSQQGSMRPAASPPPLTTAAGIVPGLDSPARQPAPALPLAPEAPAGADDPGALEPELAVDADAGPDDPSSDEVTPEPAGSAAQAPAAHAPGAAAAAGPDDSQAGPDDSQDQPDHADMPVFHRMWSSPTPPESPA